VFYSLVCYYIDKKEHIFLIYKEIKLGAVAKSYMRKGFPIYEEMRKYLDIYEEAGSHIWLCNRSLMDFFIYEENFVFFFISVCIT
jgi:sulfur relay (sulfurtransferase) DsrF/TusC family protein